MVTKPFFRRGVGLECLEELGAYFFPARTAALPFDQIRGCDAGPIGPEIEVECRRVRHVYYGWIADLAACIYEYPSLLGVENVVEEIAGSLVAAGEIEEVFSVDGIGYAHLFGAIAPVLDAVSRA